MESKSSGRPSCAGDADGSGRKGERDDEEEDDDDDITFVGSSSLPTTADHKLSSQGLYLNTRLARKSSAGGREETHHHDNADGCQRQIAFVTVVFDLPDGSQADQKTYLRPGVTKQALSPLPSTFQLGQTVEVLKSYVESEFGIPMSCQELYLGSTLMMDPMSLLDYPGVDGTGDIFVVVEGEMADEAKK